MHTQTPDTIFGFSTSDPVDCYVYGFLARSMNFSGIIIDKETRSTLSETFHSATCSPQTPRGLPFDAHRTNASR